MTMLPLLVATVNPPCPRPWARRGDARPRMSELRVGRMCDRTIARGRGSGHTVCGMSTTGASYLFNQDREQERARLAGLSAQFDPVTVRHLATVGVAAGWHCLEVGAGAGSIARWLAAMVGSTGRVVATDLDTQFLDALPIALRPGGVLVLEDLVFGAALLSVSGRIVSPPSKAAAFSRAFPAMAAGFRAVGADPEFGLELPAALAAAGLRDVDAELTSRLVRGGSAESAFYTMALRDLGPRLIAAGLLTPDDLAEPLAFVQDPASRWFSLGMVTAWGWRS